MHSQLLFCAFAVVLSAFFIILSVLCAVLNAFSVVLSAFFFVLRAFLVVLNALSMVLIAFVWFTMRLQLFAMLSG